MRSTVLIALAVAALSGCAPYIANYTVPLVSVERPAEAQERYGPPTVVPADTSEAASSLFSTGRIRRDKSISVFEDDLVRTAWLVTDTTVYLGLQNKADRSLRIIWDEAALVRTDQSCLRVLHAGVPYAERHVPQPPSVVVPGRHISENIHPTILVTLEKGSWVELSIFGQVQSSSRRYLEPHRTNIGKSVEVLLPLEIEGTVNEYIFRFTVKDVQITKRPSQRRATATWPPRSPEQSKAK